MTPRAIALRIALLLAVAGAAIWLAINRDDLDAASLERLVRDLGTWAPFGYVALFTAGTVLFVPGVLFGFAGGALFGPVWGTILNLAGGTLGAVLAFLVARHLGADWLRRKAGAKVDRLVAGVEAEGWRFVAVVRLVPFFPFNALNYALGLTRIHLWHYTVATFVCMAPATVAYTYLGYAGREALAGGEAAVRTGLVALGLFAIAAFIPRLVRRLRGTGRAEDRNWIDAATLAERLARRDAPVILDVRGADEFRGALGHLRGATNIPLDALPRRMPDLAEFKERELAVVCRTQMRSAKAADLLRAAGFTDVRVLRGGMAQWNSRRLPVEGRPPR